MVVKNHIGVWSLFMQVLKDGATGVADVQANG
jgi:hypothetical protein